MNLQGWKMLGTRIIIFGLKKTKFITQKIVFVSVIFDIHLCCMILHLFNLIYVYEPLRCDTVSVG